MCGISGIIIRSGTGFSENDDLCLDTMLKSQELRGPDSNGKIIKSRFGFAHNRLSILDLSSTGNQPMTYLGHTIVFNGEIYNYLELRNRLAEKGISFDGSSDTEVLLKLIAVEGIDTALSLLVGMFSFCVYDETADVFCLARDRMGEKPLFYYVDPAGSFYFASMPSAIVKALPQVKWKLNKAAVWQYFSMGGIFTDLTLFENIYRVDSATLIRGSRSSIEKTKYWTPSYVGDVKDNQIEELITASILSKTVSDVPISLFLSGGVDSSLVASILKGVDAIHLDSKEEEYALEIARLFKMNFSKVQPHNFSILDCLEHYCDFSGEPTQAGFIPYLTSNAIKGKYKVALTANGADELFIGYYRIPTPNIQNSFFEDKKKKSKLNIDRPSFSPRDQIFNIFRHPENFQVPIFGHQREEDLLSMISPILTELDVRFPKSSKYRWLELMTYVKCDLNSTLDFASMANSIEMRAPFLDHRLISFCLSVDETRHVSSKYGRKHFLKKMLHQNGVPDSVWNREKIGFSLNDSYLSGIQGLMDSAVYELEKEGYLKLSCKVEQKERDLVYLRSAALGFWCWKKIWIDTGLVEK